VGQQIEKPTVIWDDNKSVVVIVKNLVQYGRTKHIKVKYLVITEIDKSK